MENLTQEQILEAYDRELARRASWSTLSLEQKVEALNVKLEDEINRLYNFEFPSIDNEIHRAIQLSDDTSRSARKLYDDSVQGVRSATHELNLTIQHKLDSTVRDLIRKSDSTVVTNALREALKSLVLVTRSASRDEAQSKDTLVVRPASQAELKANSN